MLARIAADTVLLLHLTFVLLVAIGALLVLRWPRIAWLHIPASAWGVYVELSGRLCPLTTLENKLRAAAGDEGYAGSFIDHYLTPVIYPPGLTRSAQLWLAFTIILINAAVYGWLLFRRLRR